MLPDHLRSPHVGSKAGSNSSRRLLAVSAERVAAIPQCEECRKVWVQADAERWQAHWIDDGPDEKLISFCPDCAEREFE